MSMSTHVIGFKPPDETWKKYYAAYKACEEAGVKIPDEVAKYFDHEPPEEVGVRIDLRHCKSDARFAVKEYSTDSANGFEVDLMKLRVADPTIKILRFYNSY